MTLILPAFAQVYILTRNPYFAYKLHCLIDWFNGCYKPFRKLSGFILAVSALEPVNIKLIIIVDRYWQTISHLEYNVNNDDQNKKKQENKPHLKFNFTHQEGFSCQFVDSRYGL